MQPSSIPDQPSGSLRRPSADFWLKRDIDPHEVKRDIVGSKMSLHDLYLDDQDHVWLKRKGSDDSAAEYVGTLAEVITDYGQVE
jgi:hypothetical protein